MLSMELDLEMAIMAQSRGLTASKIQLSDIEIGVQNNLSIDFPEPCLGIGRTIPPTYNIRFLYQV